MQATGVPVVPGETPEDQSDEGVRRAVVRVGLPALVKASAGGGGKGMRHVRSPDEIADAVEAARREALAAFGDGTLYVERLIERPKHIEVQIFGDTHGNVVHLFERECSVQRRHQKIIEETPVAVADARASQPGSPNQRSLLLARPATAMRAPSNSCSRDRATRRVFIFSR